MSSERRVVVPADLMPAATATTNQTRSSKRGKNSEQIPERVAKLFHENEAVKIDKRIGVMPDHILDTHRGSSSLPMRSASRSWSGRTSF